MKLRFLCSTHRVELARKPEQAIHCWQNGFDTGQLLYDQKRWKEALPYLGCAFETSEILVTTKSVELGYACELFTSSAKLLANTFTRLGNATQSIEIYWLTINRLERELSHNPKKLTWINQYLSDLYRQVENPEYAFSTKSLNVAIH